MSTPAVTPDSSNPPEMSALSAAVAAQPTAPPQQAAQPQPAPAQPQSGNINRDVDPSEVQQGGSRLSRILSAVANVASTALSGIPDKGRPSAITGLGEGARAEQAAQQYQQNVQFKSFDDMQRAASIHNQDVALQNATQAQQDAHESHMQAMHANDADWGIQYDTIANHGDSVMDHLATQTAVNGAAVVPPGTHLSPDGETILIPKDTPETAAGQLTQFKAVAPALGLNVSIPDGATKLDPRVATVFYNKLQGFNANGDIYTADKLPALIASNQAQRDSLAKNGAPLVQLDALDGIIAKQKAQLKADNDAQDLATSKKTAQAKDLLNAKTAATEEINASKPQKSSDTTELNSVAFDPNFQNPDGTKGGNVVMSKADAAAKGLTHYKADPSAVNSLVAGFNDVQNKLNMLADVVNDPSRMGQVIPGTAAAMLAHGKGIGADFHGIGVDTSRINEKLYADDVKTANQATKDYVTAVIGAHEAITQLPRLQTFGKSSRMTQQQMEAAVNLLPQAGDGTMAPAKMLALQQMLDPLRRQVPHMTGAEQIPSWLEQRQQKQQQQAAPSTLGNAAGGNLVNFVKGLGK
jgi:hypothetical protein